MWSEFFFFLLPALRLQTRLGVNDEIKEKVNATLRDRDHFEPFQLVQ